MKIFQIPMEEKSGSPILSKFLLRETNEMLKQPIEGNKVEVVATVENATWDFLPLLSFDVRVLHQIHVCFFVGHGLKRLQKHSKSNSALLKRILYQILGGAHLLCSCCQLACTCSSLQPFFFSLYIESPRKSSCPCCWQFLQNL